MPLRKIRYSLLSDKNCVYIYLINDLLKIIFNSNKNGNNILKIDLFYCLTFFKQLNAAIIIFPSFPLLVLLKKKM